MKVHEEISPWKVTERMETKDFQDENHFSLPKMSVQLRRQSILHQQNTINSQLASSIEPDRSNIILRHTNSNSLRNSWISKKLAGREESLSYVYQKGGFRPSPPLIAIKKTFKYNDIIGKNISLHARQSTPIIKQRMLMLLKCNDMPQLNQKYAKSMLNQRSAKFKAEQRGTPKTNIQFIYKNEIKVKKIKDCSPPKQKAHILDNLLCQWES